MAGTLTISTLSDGTNSTSSTNCIQGSAKAWVNWNGSGGATVRASYNVSSVTRNGTGWYSINFTNAMADANYCVALSSNFANNAGNVIQYLNVNNGGVEVAPTTTKVDCTFINVANNNVSDVKYGYVTVFR